MLHWLESDADRLEVRSVFRLFTPALLDTAADEVGTVEIRQVRTTDVSRVVVRPSRRHANYHLCTRHYHVRACVRACYLQRVAIWWVDAWRRWSAAAGHVTPSGTSNNTPAAVCD